MELTTEQKGQKAQGILNDPVFIEMINDVRSQIIAQWHLTKLNDSEGRESLYMQSRGLDEAIRGLNSLADDWAIAKKRKTKKPRRR